MVDDIWIDSLLTGMIEIFATECHSVQGAACPIVEPDGCEPEIGQKASIVRKRIDGSFPESHIHDTTRRVAHSTVTVHKSCIQSTCIASRKRVMVFV